MIARVEFLPPFRTLTAAFHRRWKDDTASAYYDLLSWRLPTPQVWEQVVRLAIQDGEKFPTVKELLALTRRLAHRAPGDHPSGETRCPFCEAGVVWFQYQGARTAGHLDFDHAPGCRLRAYTPPPGVQIVRKERAVNSTWVEVP